MTTLRAALAEPVQEPVLVVEKEPDYWCRGHFHQGSKPHIDPTKVWNLPIGTKLYTDPPQRKPLTDEEILKLMNYRYVNHTIDDPDVAWIAEAAKKEVIESARAIERAHGIGGQE